MLCQWNKSVVKSLSISFWRKKEVFNMTVFIWKFHYQLVFEEKKIERIVQYDSFHLKKFNIDIIWGIWGGGEGIGL